MPSARAPGLFVDSLAARPVVLRLYPQLERSSVAIDRKNTRFMQNTPSTPAVRREV